MSNFIPCPDPDCDNGVIYVHDAYGADPLKPEEQPCDVCGGRGFLVSGDKIATAN